MATNIMSESEFHNAVETLLTNHGTRRETLSRLNDACPRNPVIEMANVYETNGDFMVWLNKFCERAV